MVEQARNGSRVADPQFGIEKVTIDLAEVEGQGSAPALLKTA
jgi:hypothetical protein